MAGRNPDPQDNRPPSSRGAREAGMSGHHEALRGVQTEETLHDIVRRILEHEAGHRQGPEELAEVSERVCRKLRSHLVDILGTFGFHFMMVRAVATAAANSKLVVDDDGCLKGLGTSVFGPSDQAILADVLAKFLDALAELVGQNLALRFIHQVWPDFLLLPPFSRSREMDL